MTSDNRNKPIDMFSLLRSRHVTINTIYDKIIATYFDVAYIIYRGKWLTPSIASAAVVKRRRIIITSAVLRLECSIDCISGSVGQWVSGSPTKYYPFIFSLSAFLLKKKKKKNLIKKV